MQKLVADVRPTVEPNLRGLEQKVRAALSPPAATDNSSTAPKAAAKPPAKAASK
jgi:hypothetical protein